MKGKRGSSYAIILFLLIIVLGQYGYALRSDVDSCNKQGGIWCAVESAPFSTTNCIYESGITCDVSVNQNVTLDLHGTKHYSETNLKKYTFNSLTIAPSIKLQFYNVPYELVSKAASATCAGGQDYRNTYNIFGKKTGVELFNSYSIAGVPITNEYTASSGGKGGKGGRENRPTQEDIRGGGGGAGAGGGKLGVAGGDGVSDLANRIYSGGAGSDGNNNICGGHGIGGISYVTGLGGLDGGKAGGFVYIKTNKIIIEGEGEISVSGENGQDGQTGASATGTGQGGYGGGPGSGGGGAGKIVIEYTGEISGQGIISANGGLGGKGGSGGNGRDCANGASGGGGGGGAGGIIGLSAMPGAIENFNDYVQCSGGIGGLPGVMNPQNPANDGNDNCNSNDDKKINGTQGGNGAKGICGTSELIPATWDEVFNPKNNCNDKIDNDGNGPIDMNDSNCLNSDKWDASIWLEYSNFPKVPTYYSASAPKIDDFVCGDDLGICVQESIVKSCKLKPILDPAFLCATDWTPEGIGRGCTSSSNFCYTIDTEGIGTLCVYNDNALCGKFNNNETLCNMVSFCSWEQAVDCSKLSPSRCKDNEINGCAISESPRISDLGGVTRDNKYLCLDSWFNSGSLSFPGNDWAWFSADGSVKTKSFSDYLIFQAGYSQYISNGKEWFQCVASFSSQITISESNRISEYGTFRGTTATGSFSCLETLEKAITSSADSSDISNDFIYDCSLTDNANDCTQKCESEGENCKGWCKDITYATGRFFEQCSPNGVDICRMKKEDGTIPYDLLEDYFSNNIDNKQSFCDANSNELGCEKFGGGGNEGDNFMDQKFCKLFQSVCSKGVIPVGKKCSELHQSSGEGDGVNKLCDANEVCINGPFVQTVPEEDGSCCFGQNAYCEAVTPETCVSSGGEMKPENCKTCVCNSNILKDDCCMYGNWIDKGNVQIGVNESFICYKQQKNSLIQECCGGNGCVNGDNLLNDETSLSPSVYSLEGVPLHSIANYDRMSDNEGLDNIPEQKVRIFSNHNSGDKISVSEGTFVKWESYALDWKNFEYLEFDIMYNAELEYTLIFEDSNGITCNYSVNNNLAVKKGPQRWQHATIKLSGDNSDNMCEADGFDSTRVADVSIFIGGDGVFGINILFDNFFLRVFDSIESVVTSVSTSVNGSSRPATRPLTTRTVGNSSNRTATERAIESKTNSENRFCSGDWGDWVNNLDGKNANDDSGFFNKSVYNDRDLANWSVFGPYRDACEGVVSFGWTGSACCGDDTKIGNYGEFWTDSKGTCWKGTTVYNDMTIADALGLGPNTNGWTLNINDTGSSFSIERSLLVYDGALISCNLDLKNYSSYEISYNGLDTNGALKISAKVDSYSIRGSWMCEQDKGWIKLENVNKVRLLAANLKAIAAEKKSDYTLVCGDYSNLVNLFGVESGAVEFLYTQNACVLRLGDNKLDNKEQVVIGLEVTPGTSFDTYAQEIENKFTVFKLDDDSNCAELESNKIVDVNTFFKQCAQDSDNGFYMYYNAPLNMIILSDGRVDSYGFNNHRSLLRTMWDSFANFFRRLFSSSNNLKLNDFESNIKSNNFYLSVQEDRTITGVMEQDIAGKDVAGNSALYDSLRVDYSRLSTNVSMLANAIKFNYPESIVKYTAYGYNQSIYVKVNAVYAVDWKIITSILRLNPEGISIDFG